MRAPESLLSLIDEGMIDEVVRPLMSGKEAQVYLVRSDGELRVAKVYKQAQLRTFKQRAEYTEGRNVRNSRDQRAMSKRTRHGREQDEAAWRSAEVDMIYRLRAAGVRVPTPHHFVDGVLIMQLVTNADGEPAPRLGDLTLDREGAIKVFDQVLAEVVRMLAAGVVHGDLSDFNVLMAADGPVIIDFPQAVDASSNMNARKLLLRDVDNLHRFMSRFMPGRQPPPYAQEMWQLYERGELTADVRLTGHYRASEKQANTDSVLALIADAERDERHRRQQLGLQMRGGATPDNSRTPAPAQSARAATGAQGPIPARRQEVFPTPRRDMGPQRNVGPQRNAGPRRDMGPQRNAGPQRDMGPQRNAGPQRDMGPQRDAAMQRSNGPQDGAQAGAPKRRRRRRRKARTDVVDPQRS